MPVDFASSPQSTVLHQLHRENPQFSPMAFEIVLNGICAICVSGTAQKRDVPLKEFVPEFCNYCVESFGPLAKVVLEQNGIRGVQDIRTILSELRRLRGVVFSDQDNIEDLFATAPQYYVILNEQRVLSSLTLTWGQAALPSVPKTE
jgi:uncharacterized repeat protein (TIGR04138 family)